MSVCYLVKVKHLTRFRVRLRCYRIICLLLINKNNTNTKHIHTKIITLIINRKFTINKLYFLSFTIVSFLVNLQTEYHKICINNRKVLNGLFREVNQEQNAVDIMRTIDKLAKIGKEKVILFQKY